MKNEAEELKNEIENLKKSLQKMNSENDLYKEEILKVNKVLQKVSDQLKQQIEFATTIQKKLSPTEFPNMQGLEFSQKFVPGVKWGGDYFDMFELDDKMSFAILLASSSGYGMSSLLMSIVLKITFSREAKKDGKPHQFVNQIISEVQKNNLPATDQTSLFYGILNRRTFNLEYASIGDVHSFVADYPKNEISLLVSDAEPVKVGRALLNESQNIQLNERSRLILTSTGVAGTKNASDENFGVERLITAIRSAPQQGVHELRNEVLFQLERYRGKVESQRDLAIIVCEIKDKIIKLTKKEN